MAQYSVERKQAILNKLLSPELISIAQLARDEHIAEQTLYNWRNRAKQQGKAVPTSPDKCSFIIYRTQGQSNCLKIPKLNGFLPLTVVKLNTALRPPTV